METLFPFFLSFDSNLRVVDLGRSLRKILPTLAPGSLLTEHFLLERPHIPFSFEALLNEAHSMFLLRQIGRRFLLRGQIAVHPSPNQQTPDKITYLCSPWLVASGSLQALGLELADFALHDPMPEFTQVLHSNRLAMDDLGRLSAKLQEQRQTLREAKSRLELSLEQERAARKEAESALAAQSTWLSNLKGQITAYLPNAGSSQLFLRDLDDQVSSLQSGEHKSIHADFHFKVAELFNELAHFLRKIAEAKGVSISISCHDLDGFVTGDRNLLHRLLIELAHNAIKFSDGGELAITAHPTDGNLVVFKVMDTGRGIAPQTLSRIQAAFKRPRFSAPTVITHSGSPSPESPPSGLGLALAKQIADLLDGSIEVYSTLHQGSLFTVTLPLPVFLAAPAAEPETTLTDLRLILSASNTNNTADLLPSAPWPTPPSNSPFPSISPIPFVSPFSSNQPNPSHFITTPHKHVTTKRRMASLDIQVLLLEPAQADAAPAPTIPPLPKALMEEDGFRIDVATNADDLLAMLEYAQYDLVLLDAFFLSNSGLTRQMALDAARRIRTHEPDPENRLPILALAAKVDQDLLRQCAAAGIDDCLPLPIEILHLHEALSRVSHRS